MTEPAGRAEAQRRANRIQAFREELEALEREGALILSPEQRSALEHHLAGTLAELSRRFDVDATESQKQISWGLRIVSTLGGLAFCAAVFLFFYRFWGLLSTPAQVAVLALAPALAVAATHVAARKERTLYYAALLSMVAVASFILDLTALGQIFNLIARPAALLAWGAFALAIAYSYGLRLPLAAGLVCALGYVAASLAELNGAYWLSFVERWEQILLPGLLVAAVGLTTAHRARPEFPPVYRLIGLLAVFLSILSLSRGEPSYLPIQPNRAKVLYEALGFVAAGGAVWLGIRRHWAGVVNLGATSFAIFLFSKYFDWWWEWMPKYVFFFVVGLTAVLLMVLFRKLRARIREAPA
jgi:uncharacterized membrane protein